MESEYILKDIVGEFVLVPVNNPKLKPIALNGTGAFIFKKLIIEKLQKEQVINEYKNEYGLTEEMATTEVNTYINDLIEMKVIAE